MVGQQMDAAAVADDSAGAVVNQRRIGPGGVPVKSPVGILATVNHRADRSGARAPAVERPFLGFVVSECAETAVVEVVEREGVVPPVAFDRAVDDRAAVGGSDANRDGGIDEPAAADVGTEAAVHRDHAPAAVENIVQVVREMFRLTAPEENIFDAPAGHQAVPPDLPVVRGPDFAVDRLLEVDALALHPVDTVMFAGDTDSFFHGIGPDVPRLESVQVKTVRLGGAHIKLDEFTRHEFVGIVHFDGEALTRRIGGDFGQPRPTGEIGVRAESEQFGHREHLARRFVAVVVAHEDFGSAGAASFPFENDVRAVDPDVVYDVFLFGDQIAAAGEEDDAAAVRLGGRDCRDHSGAITFVVIGNRAVVGYGESLAFGFRDIPLPHRIARIGEVRETGRAFAFFEFDEILPENGFFAANPDRQGQAQQQQQCVKQFHR